MYGKKLGKSRNGTKHLHDHFKICPLRRQRDIRQSCLKPTKTNEEKLVLNLALFYYEACRRDLACAITLHEYPINMVEHKGFKKFLSGVQPMIKMISRSTMRRDIIKIYEEERIKTLKFLESNKSRVALTTDTWTATSQKKGYMAITAHFIDDSWVLQSRLLRKFDLNISSSNLFFVQYLVVSNLTYYYVITGLYMCHIHKLDMRKH